MKYRAGKNFVLLAMLCLLLLSMTGCKVSKKKVQQSPYYKELKEKYKKLDKENKKLKEKSENQKEISDAEKRAEKYVAKIARDKLTRVEVGFPDCMEDCYYIEEKEVYGEAINLAKNADHCSKYTPEELEKNFTPKYKYVLYDENNAIYELLIYPSNYVVFSDLPNYVYYIPEANILGDAFLENRTILPDGGLLHDLSECPLMVDSEGICYGNNVAISIANCIDQMNKEKSSREKAENAWEKAASKKGDDSAGNHEPKSESYIFYTHGKQMIVTLYDRYLSIMNVNEKRTWYKVSKADIKNVKTILRNDQKSREIVIQDEDTASSKESTSHQKEIEEESVISNENP